ncbi:NAD(P)H-quinone oxidoreductase subunit [Zostera marina]|uniref:NAD(P)H-quinone oxidoreductase subunit n=1 Tax=Zostera marina TaxID=29655 RepID=A0A0K9PNY4_ZOSMR|nr:NAD(P)H-quinone oxidoreductase subunit [Zostera marina]
MDSSLLFFSTKLSTHFTPQIPLFPHKSPVNRTLNNDVPRRVRVVAAAKDGPKEEKIVPKRPKKPVYSLKKGQIVRVDKDKYLDSVNYLSVGHPLNYKGLDYIYEDRGEVLDVRIFDTGEYALIAWVGIPTAPAWLPTDMLHKSDKLDYERV